MSTGELPKLRSLIIIVTLAWASFWVAAWWYLDWTKSGGFGDSFGAVNSLFSGLALAFIIYSIVQQQIALTLQKQEMKQALIEFRTQNESLKMQRFENTFFNLISLHHSLVDKISIEVNGTKIVGHESLRHLNSEFRQLFAEKQKELGKLDLYSFNPHRSAVMNVFTKFYNSRDEHLSQCFANFITLATVTKESNLLTDDVKEQYFSIIASQIHPCEIALLFYYFQVGKGNNVKSLFNDLGLPRKIDQNLLADKDHLFLFDSDEAVKDILTKNIRS